MCLLSLCKLPTTNLWLIIVSIAAGFPATQITLGVLYRQHCAGQSQLLLLWNLVSGVLLLSAFFMELVYSATMRFAVHRKTPSTSSVNSIKTITHTHFVEPKRVIFYPLLVVVFQIALAVSVAFGLYVVFDQSCDPFLDTFSKMAACTHLLMVLTLPAFCCVSFSWFRKSDHYCSKNSQDNNPLEMDQVVANHRKPLPMANKTYTQDGRAYLNEGLTFNHMNDQQRMEFGMPSMVAHSQSHLSTQSKRIHRSISSDNSDNGTYQKPFLNRATHSMPYPYPLPIPQHNSHHTLSFSQKTPLLGSNYPNWNENEQGESPTRYANLHSSAKKGQAFNFNMNDRQQRPPSGYLTPVANGGGFEFPASRQNPAYTMTWQGSPYLDSNIRNRSNHSPDNHESYMRNKPLLDTPKMVQPYSARNSPSPARSNDESVRDRESDEAKDFDAASVSDNKTENPIEETAAICNGTIASNNSDRQSDL